MKIKELLKKELCVVVFLATIVYGSLCFTNNEPKSSNKENYIDFDTRLQFYLDMKTKRFLQKMSVKERFLLQMIQNLLTELMARGKDRLTEDHIDFEIIYGESDKLLDDYTKEIDVIINIINELNKLEAMINKKDDIKLLNEVDEIKDNLLRALDDKKLAQEQLTKKQVASMINEYSSEINVLVKLYNEIESFEKKAQAVGDIEILKQLQGRKKQILQTLELSGITSPLNDKTVNDYIKEVTDLIKILKELDKLGAEVESDISTVYTEIDTVRKNVIANIDDRILHLFGYSTSHTPNGPTLSEYFKEWKAKRIAEFHLKLTQYRILRDQLIKSAHESERDRMLECELNDALLNYSNDKYELATLQLNEIYKTYNPYYKKLVGVIFYSSEANYANGYFDAAFSGYAKIIEDYPNSQYLAKTYLRLIFISYTYGWYDKFLNYYKNLLLTPNVPIEDLNEANYLAGFIYFKQRKFVDSRQALQNVVQSSKYYMASQFLQGIVYANLDNYTKAKMIFEELINKKNYPWTDINTAIIQNESLLKLGYLHYQRGEYNQAISYFEQVSKGYAHYDYSLVGQAWAIMKKGEFDATVNRVNQLISNYLLSNYTYEALVLAAHCRKITNNNEEAIRNLQYVTNAKDMLEKTKEYNEERRRILNQMKEVERLEEKILERQNQSLYPQVVKIRDRINSVLMSSYYQGPVSNHLMEEFNNERKILIRQIQEFEAIMQLAEKQQNEKMYQEAKNQYERLLIVLETYQFDKSDMHANYFIDYPLAVKEGGYIYRKEIINKVVDDLLSEKKRVKTDLDMITQLLASSDASTSMEAIMDLEILEEDLQDLHNQLNKFQVWLANHQIKEISTDSEKWADFSGFGISDINYATYHQQMQQLNTLSQNINLIDKILKNKKEVLENKINRFDSEVIKIKKEMEAEKIRLEKLEKEKYFRQIYFDTKTKEIVQEDETENYFKLDDKELEND